MKWLSWVLFVFLISIAVWRVHMLTAWQVPCNWQVHPVALNFRVVSQPHYHYGRLSWVGRLMIPGQPLVKLSWSHPARRLHSGDSWHGTIQLKTLSRVRHWHDFDMAQWLRSQGIRAVGKIQANSSMQLISHTWHPVAIMRRRLKYQIKQLALSKVVRGMLLAFTTGSHEMIPRTGWPIFQKTGTNHLIAIAGLHLGLVMTLSMFIWCNVLKCLPVCGLWCPRQVVAWCLSLLSVWGYAAMANFTLPTIRAVSMLTVMVLMHINRHLLPWRLRWGVAIGVVLLLNPLVIMTASFWLSFISVLLIMQVCLGELAQRPHWQQWCRIQAVLCFGLAPLTAYFFHQVSLIGFVANAIAVPWVLVLVLPLCIFALLVHFFSVSVAMMLLKFAGVLLTPLWLLLVRLAHIHIAATEVVHVANWRLVAAMVGVCLLCTPCFRSYRWLGLVYFMPFVSLL